MGIEIILDVVLLGVCVVSVWSDLRTGVIYDWVTYLGIGIGLVARCVFYGLGGIFDLGLVSAILGAFVGGLIFSLFIVWGKGVGGGEVRLVCAVGALSGFVHTLTCLMCIALIGGGLALVLISFRRKLLAASKGIFRDWFTTLRDGKVRVTLPYALPVALGVVWAILIKY